jgi:hypothetical protein
MLSTVLLCGGQIIGATSDAKGKTGKPGVDFNVFNAGRKDPHRQLSYGQNGRRHQLVIKFVILAIADGEYRAHLLREDVRGMWGTLLDLGKASDYRKPDDAINDIAVKEVEFARQCRNLL